MNKHELENRVRQVVGKEKAPAEMVYPTPE
jgi:hypothetical protein